MKDFELLPNDEETARWYNENIGAGCSASSAVYKFRMWLKERQDLKIAYDKADKTAKEFGKPEPQPKYEFEMFFKSETTDVVKIDGWYPIATDRIKHPDRIEEYIDKGLIRRIKFGIFRNNATGNGGWDVDGMIKGPSTDREELENICKEMNENKLDSWHYYSVYETNDDYQALVRGEVISNV